MLQLQNKDIGMGYGTLVSLVFHNLPSLYPSSFCRNDFLYLYIYIGLENIPPAYIGLFITKARPYRLIRTFVSSGEQNFVARKFPTFSSSSSSFFFFIFFFFFLSHSPSALRKQGTVLIFTQNVTTGDGGVHRPQAIDSSLLYETRANRGFLEFM